MAPAAIGFARPRASWIFCVFTVGFVAIKLTRLLAGSGAGVDSGAGAAGVATGAGADSRLRCYFSIGRSCE